MDQMKEKSTTPRSGDDESKIYTQNELLEFFNGLNLDTKKYTFEYIAEQLGFQQINEGKWLNKFGKMIIPTLALTGALHLGANANDMYHKFDAQQSQDNLTQYVQDNPDVYSLSSSGNFVPGHAGNSQLVLQPGSALDVNSQQYEELSQDEKDKLWDRYHSGNELFTKYNQKKNAAKDAATSAAAVNTAAGALYGPIALAGAAKIAGNKAEKKKETKDLSEFWVLSEKSNLFDNIRKKQKRIKSGSGEKMKKSNQEGYPHHLEKIAKESLNEGIIEDAKNRILIWGIGKLPESKIDKLWSKITKKLSKEDKEKVDKEFSTKELKVSRIKAILRKGEKEEKRIKNKIEEVSKRIEKEVEKKEELNESVGLIVAGVASIIFWGISLILDIIIGSFFWIVLDVLGITIAAGWIAQGFENSDMKKQQYSIKEAVSLEYFSNVILNEKSDILKKHGVAGYNKPKRTPGHKTKSHLVVAKKGEKVKVIRFGSQGAKGSPRKDGESKDYAKRRSNWVKRHKAQNPGAFKDKMSPLYWANKVKW